ncbi:MAG: hypothetical protein JSV64_07505 [Candidatus Bathyarchaeota archaeon]|nr:MAG: hypothetical protein JSV64_07505 [Candidatus Bathyarchaeota archaeon]
MTRTFPKEQQQSRKFAGYSAWLSRNMIDNGCTLTQTLHVLQERCKDCNVITPMLCVEQCSTWSVKKELHETDRILSRHQHELQLVNAIKNRRRLAILRILRNRSMNIRNLQKELGRTRYHHSKKTIYEYLKPLLSAGLVRASSNRYQITLYGRKIHNIITRHYFSGKLPIHSEGYEERILRSLLISAKTRKELLEEVPTKSLSRILKRLKKAQLIIDRSPSDRVFYFRTKRALGLESLSLTQERICNSIPRTGISARDLARTVGISLRRTYRYLRNLRGKKLVFRRNIPVRHELTARGRRTAEFLEEIASIE